MSKCFAMLAAIVVVGGSAAVSFSDQSCCTTSCCAHCGCGQFRKVCCPVHEVKKETVYEYSCKCEDFCVPGPSKCVGTRCEPDCSGCPKCCKVMMPTCAEVRCRKVLVKTPVVKETCVVKWVVKTVCCGCGNACGSCCEPACGAVPGCDQAAFSADADLTPPAIPTEVQVGHTAPVHPNPTSAVSFPSRLFRNVDAATRQ